MLRGKGRSQASKLAAAIAFASIVTQFLQATRASEQQTEGGRLDKATMELAALDKEIAVKELSLAELSLRFRLNSNQQPEWRALRYSALQDGFGGGLLGLDTELLAQQGSNFQAHPVYSNNALRGGFNAGLVGTVLGASSSAIELGSNTLIACKNRRNQMDPATVLKSFSTDLKSLDQMLAQRRELLKNAAGNDIKPLFEARGRIFSDGRDLTVAEFVQHLKNEKRLAWFQNSYYALDTAKNTFGAVSTGLGIKSVTRPTLIGPSDIWLVITGSFIIGESLLSDAAGSIAMHYYDCKMKQRFKTGQLKKVAVLEEDKKALEELIESGRFNRYGLRPFTRELAGYHIGRYYLHNQSVADRLQQETYHRVAVQQAIVGPLIGLSFLAQGLLGLIGAYGMPSRAAASNSLNFAGSISGLCGSLLTVGATTNSYISSLRFDRKLKKKNALPQALLEENLLRLNKLKQEIESSPSLH